MRINNFTIPKKYLSWSLSKRDEWAKSAERISLRLAKTCRRQTLRGRIRKKRQQAALAWFLASQKMRNI